MNRSLDLNKTVKLNKTIKLNKNSGLIRTLSVSKKKNKPKNYLSDTISSSNKKTVKFENTKQQALYSTKILNYNAKLYQTYRQKSNISESIYYYDNFNHFSNNSDFGNDPFGHFD
jgi:hypothetical protein